MMNQYNNESLDLFIALSRANQWVNAISDQDIRENDMTRTEFAVLELLHHKGPQPIQQIGNKVLMSSGNITYVVDKLEKKGFAQRRASSKDRRLIYAEVTPAGSEFIEQKFPKHIKAIERAVSGLSSEEKKIATALLKKLGKAAQERS
jgi:MarR family 2-MHQ and catechol resistance regulon transcriptional repressor